MTFFSTNVYALAIACTALSLSGCGIFRKSDKHVTPPVQEPVALFVAEPNNGFDAQLLRCVRAASEADSCKLSDLPILGMTTSKITISDVMKRLVVSNDWMKVRFAEVLEKAPEEVISMFRAVTAVVISRNIRPSYYTSATGAIYLDPRYLCKTEEECNDVSKEPDYREAYKSYLRFEVYNSYDYTEYPEKRENLGYRVERLSRLLFHELGHANDFLPPSVTSKIKKSETILEAIDNFEGSRVSDQLERLGSDKLRSLAKVRYKGVKPKEDEMAFTAEQLRDELKGDKATSFYSYLTQYEDLSMTFENYMMAKSFKMPSYIDIYDITNPQKELFVWMQKNRFMDSDILKRAEFIYKGFFPDKPLPDASVFF